MYADVDKFYSGYAGKTTSDTFGQSIQRRLKVVEVSVNKKAEEPKKLEGRVVLETVVEEGMSFAP